MKAEGNFRLIYSFCRTFLHLTEITLSSSAAFEFNCSPGLNNNVASVNSIGHDWTGDHFFLRSEMMRDWFDKDMWKGILRLNEISSQVNSGAKLDFRLPHRRTRLLVPTQLRMRRLIDKMQLRLDTWLQCVFLLLISEENIGLRLWKVTQM